ncbi:hypothetical protein N566_23335 [Streptomycetaceae bacterium MP113-05]|nr:hypothetical protein N566_23335 [Streptomycetaceae bacterium MP113-05]
MLREGGPDVAGGSMAGVLESAAAVLEDPAVADLPEATDARVRARRLIDALADAP